MIKALTAITLLLALGAVALANPTPVERPRLALVNAVWSELCAKTLARSELCASGIILGVAIAVQRWRFLPIGAGPVPQDAPSPVVPLSL